MLSKSYGSIFGKSVGLKSIVGKVFHGLNGWNRGVIEGKSGKIGPIGPTSSGVSFLSG